MFIYQHQNMHLNVKIIFLRTICHNSYMFRSIWIIFRELLNMLHYSWRWSK